MEARKNLKFMSIAMLVLAGLTLIRVLFAVFTIDNNAEAIIEEVTPGLLLTSQIIVCVISLILLAPQVYVGLKGLKVSKTPDSSKAHIVWATILAVISAISIVTIVLEGNFAENWTGLLDVVADVAIYITYIQYAKQVLKEAQ